MCAQALDDSLLRETCDHAATMLTLVAIGGDLADDEEQYVVKQAEWLSEVPGAREWLRAYVLALSLEYEYRFRHRPSSASVLDEIPWKTGWPVPSAPFGLEPTHWQIELLSRWLQMVQDDEFPVWTRRGAPLWLPGLIWKEPNIGSARESSTVHDNLRAEDGNDAVYARPEDAA